MKSINWGILGAGNVANQFAKEFILQKSQNSKSSILLIRIYFQKKIVLFLM